MTFRTPYLIGAAVLCVCAAACNKEQDGISQYDVPKESAVFEENHVGKTPPPGGGADDVDAKPVKKQRMLAALVVTPKKFWFFKILGPNADVNAVARDFAAFMATVDFKDGKPTWTLPKGWRQTADDDPRNIPKSQFDPGRAATILVDPNNDQLDLAVSSLPNNAADKDELEESILQNVNRWRGQMGLPGRTLATLYDKEGGGSKVEIVDEVLKADVHGRKVVITQFVGFPKPRRPGRGPFMGR